MRSDTSIRPSYRWATFTLLSAEHSLEETVRRAGGSWQAGMAVRIADVDVTSVNAAVDAGHAGRRSAASSGTSAMPARPSFAR